MAYADNNISENIATPLIYCKSVKNEEACLQSFQELWEQDMIARNLELKKNCLENTFCAKQFSDLNALMLEYNTSLNAFLMKYTPSAYAKITALGAQVTNLQYHLLATGYGCKPDDARCITVNGEKDLSYSLQHLASYHTGLTPDILLDDELREAAITEIDDLLNIQYRKYLEQCANDDCRKETRSMEISWIKYKEKMLNYLEDPLAAGSAQDNYLQSDLFLLLSTLHQTSLLGFICEDGSFKCIVNEEQLRDISTANTQIMDDELPESQDTTEVIESNTSDDALDSQKPTSESTATDEQDTSLQQDNKVSSEKSVNSKSRSIPSSMPQPAPNLVSDKVIIVDPDSEKEQTSESAIQNPSH